MQTSNTIIYYHSEDYELVCEYCACGGIEYVDWIMLGDVIPNVHGCFEVAKANAFCGNMVVVTSNNECYCRGKGKENSCTQQPGFPGNVYRMDTGKLGDFQFE